MKKLKYAFITLALLIVLYLAGPTPPKPLLTKQLPVVGGSVENYVFNMEHKPGLKLKPGCEAKILWVNDSLKQSTPYALLYLHGFSASWHEGYPVNVHFAEQFGCNAFLARLAAHGEISDDPLLGMTPDRLYESAKEALVVANQLGQKVVIMGCSTGCTLALKLAADFPDRVFGLMLLSPNVQIKQKSAQLLSGPWGLQIAQLNFGGRFRTFKVDPNSDYCKYWNCRYRAEAPVYLQQLLDATMKKELFTQVKCPVFMGYYYKDEEHQDNVVEVKAALRMFDELGTPTGKKRAVAFPNAGNHVLGSDITSQSVQEVEKAAVQFAGDLLGMQRVQ